jgi:3-isopropylmalate/(R)-2-methylmalate dehydratase large subunit
MGKTLAEKILGSHAGYEVSAGEIAIAKVDLCLFQDGTGPLAIRQLEKLGAEKLANPDRVVFFLDHSAPSSRKELSNDHKFIRDFCKKTGARYSEVGKGICHVVINEDYVVPGEILIGADSHTCTGGALGCFSTGMGSTDVAIGAAYGKSWFRVPESFKVYVTGEFPLGVFPKDLILHLIGMIGADGATYKSLEFCGPAIENMDMSARFTLSNMAVEAGAKAGLIASDETTKKYLESRGRGNKWKPLKADDDAVYERVIEIDVSTLAPTVSYPHTVDNTHTIDEAAGIKVNQVFLGTCTNSRTEDWEVVSKIVKGKKIAPGMRFVAIPGSLEVMKEVLERGYYQTLVDFGAVMVPPGCGPCVGIHGGIPADGEVSLTTMNRNFHGRMGNPNAEIYLGSPAVIAATAIEGVIADPRKYTRELKTIGKPQYVNSVALKAVATSAQKTLERMASDTATVWGPKAKEATISVEKAARKATDQYGPKVKKAAADFEKTLTKLATDATKAIKDALGSKPPKSSGKKPTAKKATPKKAAKKKAAKTAVKKKVKKKAVKKAAKKAQKKTVKKKSKRTGRR